MKYYYILLLFLCPVLLYGQSYTSKKEPQKSRRNLQKAAKDLSESLEQEAVTDTLVAANYMKLAMELYGKEEYGKAETYLKSARQIYERVKDKEKMMEVERRIARTQEAQNKIDEAISSYRNAGRIALSPESRQLNLNDASRLENKADPAMQASYIVKNLEITGQSEQKTDRVNALRQMAAANVAMNRQEEAIENLETVLDEVKDEPIQAMKVQREIANVYTSNQQYEKGIAPLQEAYEVALNEGNTLEAGRNASLLADLYTKNDDPAKAVAVYSGFLARLDTLVRRDSTLIDGRFFEVHEQRIAQLEKERALKDELISKQSLFNNALSVFVALILVSLFLIARSLYSIKRKNKRIALQSLRREMNPHFIFNSLNSVNQYIAQNNELEANKYLSSYSRLMRNMMHNSNRDFTPLATELEQLREYLELEQMRFSDKFVYRIDVDEAIDAEAVSVPNMLIQPYLENAIWHGLRYRETKGTLLLSIRKDDNQLCVFIDDDGIGLAKSAALKTQHQKNYESRGMKNTQERILLLNSLYKARIEVKIMEKEAPETGVRVTVCFPLKHITR